MDPDPYDMSLMYNTLSLLLYIIIFRM
jgi:hypothetical protein